MKDPIEMLKEYLIKEAVLSEDGKTIDFDGVNIPVEVDYKELRKRIVDYLSEVPRKDIYRLAVEFNLLKEEEKTMSDPIKALQEYLNTKAEQGDFRISHTNQDGSDAGYSYWYGDDYSSLCWEVMAEDLLFNLREAVLSEDGRTIDFDGVKIPVEVDYKELRKRIADIILSEAPRKDIYRLAVEFNLL